MDVDADATSAFHHLHRVADVGDAALAEDVDFHQSDFLGGIHVVLRRREAFRRQVEGCIVGDGVFGHQHTACMDGTLSRKVLKSLGNGHNLLTDSVVFRKLGGIAFHLVNFLFGQTEHLAQLATKRIALEGDRCAKQGDVLCAIFFEDVRDDMVAVAPREVEVEVGRTAPLGVEETLKIQVQLYRVHIGDFQAISHHAIGPAAPPDVVKSLRHCEAHNIPSDEEIGAKAHPLDDVQLLLDAAVSGLVGCAVAVHHAVESQLA